MDLLTHWATKLRARFSRLANRIDASLLLQGDHGWGRGRVQNERISYSISLDQICSWPHTKSAGKVRAELARLADGVDASFLQRDRRRGRLRWLGRIDNPDRAASERRRSRIRWPSTATAARAV